MTAPLPPDITALLADLQEALPDPAHDLLRAKVLAAMQKVWDYHTTLLSDLDTTNASLTQAQAVLAAAQQQITDQQTAIDDLQTRVTALENPPPPAP